ncbi:Uncharacterised protein [Mycobacteroides abscessus]|nr:Uncharacterised protein [Mycobacteroides abscessus]
MVSRARSACSRETLVECAALLDAWTSSSIHAR